MQESQAMGSVMRFTCCCSHILEGCATQVLEEFCLRYDEVTKVPQECGAENFFLPQPRSGCFSLRNW